MKESDILNIFEDLSFQKLDTVLDLMECKVEGLNLPFMYAGGTEHTSFPWHIEDGSLWSFGFLLAGKRKCL